MGLVRSDIPEQSPKKLKIIAGRINTYKKKFLFFLLQISNMIQHYNPPYEQRFLSGMAYSIYQVVRVACQSCSWSVYTPTESTVSYQIILHGVDKGY